MTETPKEIFISYDREDLARVLEIVAPLEETASVWIDKRGIRPSDSFLRKIEAAISHCTTLVVMLSTHSVTSDFVLKEMARAHACGKPIIPICLDPIGPDEMPLLLADIDHVEWHNADCEGNFRRLLDKLDEQGVAILPLPPSPRGNPLPPRPDAPFLDRVDERRDITESLGQGKHVVIAAMGGAGKSRLAHEAAADILETKCFDDGVYWIDLRPKETKTTETLGPEVMAGYVVEALDKKNSGAQRDRLAGMEKLCRDRKALIWIDNCDSPEAIAALRDIAPLLGQCTVLVTTRNFLLLNHALPLDLGVLPEQEAVNLLAELAGEPPPEGERCEAMARLSRVLGHLPLAIDLLAGKLKHGEFRGWALEDVHAAIKALPADDRLHWLYESQYAQMRPAAQRCLMACGLLATSVLDVEVVQAVVAAAGHTPPEVAAALGSLASAHLLTRQGVGFTIHPIVRGFAATLLTESPERDAMHRSYLEFLVRLAEDRATTTDRLVRFRDDLELGLELALARGWLRQALQLAEALIGDHWDRPKGPAARLGWWSSMQRLLARLTADLRRAGSVEGRTAPGFLSAMGLLHKNASLFSYWLGDNQRCLDEAELALEWYLRAGDTNGEAVAIQLPAYIYDDTCDYALADTTYRAGLARAEVGGDAKFIALSHHLVGCCLYHQLRNEEADQEFQTALACAAYCKDKLCQSRTTRRVATVRMRQGRIDEAEELLKVCLGIEISHHSKRDQARSLRHLGRLEMMKQPPDLAAARDCLDRSMTIMEEIMSLRGTGAVQLNQATCARLRGESEEGLRLVGLSLKTAERLDAPYAQALCQMEWAALAAAQGQPVEAREHHAAAVTILEALHLPAAVLAEDRRIGWSGDSS